MGISLQTSTRPSNMPQVNPRTFDWGQRGTIEMKPMDVVAQSTLAPGGPQPAQQVTQPEGPPDPYQMWEQQTTDAIKQQETLYQMGVAEATKKTRFKMQTLEREYGIKKDALEREAKMVGPEQRDNYNKRFLALDTQYTIAAERLQDKDAPDLSELEAQNQKAMMQIQETAKEKKITLDIYKRLGDTGELDPKESLRLQLNELGLNVTRSDMQPPNPQQRLRELGQFITFIKEKMDISKQMMGEYGKSLLTPDEQVMLDAAKKEYAELQLQINPGLAPIINRPKLADTNMSSRENKGGTIGALFNNWKNPNAAPAAKQQEPITQQNKKTGQMRVSYDGGKTWQIQ